MDFKRGVLVLDEEQEVWANCKFLMKTGEIYGIELNESTVGRPFDSAFLWRTNGERMKVVLDGYNPYAFERIWKVSL